jgi:predicted enzyme related to lactoylglutathione lyase
MADQLLGSFVWCELMTTDMAGAESFYKQVVGWNPAPFAPDGSYVVFNKPGGAGTGGMMLLPDAAKQMGVPPHWLMYVGTPDVDATAIAIAQLGGRVVKQPADIPNTGRFAVVQDPYGATFGIYQPAMAGARSKPGVGDFSWFELYTPNPDGAWGFYSKLFGWEKTEAMDMGPEVGLYQMFGRGDGVPRGGIMKPPPGAPAAWAPYAMVKDAKASAEIAIANGGKIVNGPMEVPGGDWIAQGIDPQGAMFSVHSLSPAAQKAAAVKETIKKVAKTVAKAVAAAVVVGAAAKQAKKAVKKAAPRKATPVKKSAKPAKKSAAKKTPTSARATVGKKAKPAKKSAKPSKKKAVKKTAAKKASKKPKKK